MVRAGLAGSVIVIIVVVGTTAGWNWAFIVVGSALVLIGGLATWRRATGTPAPRSDPVSGPAVTVRETSAPAVLCCEADGPAVQKGSHRLRFDAQLLFAEAHGTRLVIDGLADTPGNRGVVGVPFSLSFTRPPSWLAEDFLVAVVAQCAQNGCQIEVDTVNGHPTVRLVSADRELAVAVESASGLPAP